MEAKIISAVLLIIGVVLFTVLGMFLALMGFSFISGRLNQMALVTKHPHILSIMRWVALLVGGVAGCLVAVVLL